MLSIFVLKIAKADDAVNIVLFIILEQRINFNLF